MTSVESARNIVNKTALNLGTETIPFLKSLGRVLKEDICADRDFPPFNRVAMDGIAINFEAFHQGIYNYTIEGIQPAGDVQRTLINTHNCYEVMTGAVLPMNCDTVIRYEDLDIKNGVAFITITTVTKGQNVHIRGKDRIKNDLIIEKNTIISAAEIGILATVGKATVKVAKLPKVLIISTGDELVNVDKYPEKHQIRRSNVFTLVSLLNHLNIDADTDHIPDEKPILKHKIATYLKTYDALLFSGAVSKGKYDFLPEVLEELGVQKLFHRISQRPGKPFWFGTTNDTKINSKTFVFAFPGNPISTFVNCKVYFYEWFYTSTSVKRSIQTAILGDAVIFKPNLTYFLHVRLKSKYGHLVAYPVNGNGSGDLASLVEADGFIEIPKSEQTEFKEGETFPVITYRH